MKTENTEWNWQRTCVNAVEITDEYGTQVFEISTDSEDLTNQFIQDIQLITASPQLVHALELIIEGKQNDDSKMQELGIELGKIALQKALF